MSSQYLMTSTNRLIYGRRKMILKFRQTLGRNRRYPNKLAPRDYITHVFILTDRRCFDRVFTEQRGGKNYNIQRTW